MTEQPYLARVKELENAIRIHRAQKADDRCIEDDDRLYEVLGDGIKCDRRVGCQEDMLANCKRFIENRTEGGGWPTYAELENKVADLEDENRILNLILAISKGQREATQETGGVTQEQQQRNMKAMAELHERGYEVNRQLRQQIRELQEIVSLLTVEVEEWPKLFTEMKD